MDYIIIALWGLVAGGLLFGGSSSRNILPQSAAEVESIHQLIEQPTDIGKKHTKVVDASVSATSTKPIIITDGATTNVPVVRIVHSKSTALSFKSGGYSDSDKAVSTAANKALDFNKEKKGSKESMEAAPRTRVQRDTIVVYAIKSPDGEYYTLDREKAISEPQVEIDSDEDLTITEPLFESEQIQEHPTEVIRRNNVRLPKGLRIEQLLCDENGNPVMHKLKSGESLTQIAQHYFEDACFWPYIFEVNHYKLTSPDRLQAGMKLYLPDPDYYDIDGENPRSVSKAKSKITKYIK